MDVIDRPTSSDTALLEVRDLDVAIGAVQVVEGLSFELRTGDSVGILGPNGVGKTTLLLTVAGLRVPQRGAIRLTGLPIERMPRRAIAQRLGMLTQNTRFGFDASCLEIALSGRHPHLGPLQGESVEDRARAERALEAVGLSGLARRSCLALSGGEQRRLALARVLTQDPAVLLLDEPTNHLDPAHQVRVLDHLWRRNRQQGGVQLLALHDPNLALCYCNRVLLLYGDGRWAFGAAHELLDADRLSALYGCTIRQLSDGRQSVFAVAGGPVDDTTG